MLEGGCEETSKFLHAKLNAENKKTANAPVFQNRNAMTKRKEMV